MKKTFFDKIKLCKKYTAFAYIVMMTAVLPLYMEDGFRMIGDAKYRFFWYVSIFFVALGGVLVAASWLLDTERKKEKRNDINGRKSVALSYPELFALFFIVTTILSTFFSAYTKTALYGFDDWHMGLYTQFFLMTGFFIASRWGGCNRYALIPAWVSAVLICHLTMINRCGDDPLGVYHGMDWFDWNRRNLLATIGNINWVCCYLAVAVPILCFCYWKARGYLRILAFIGAFSGMAAMMLQGSAAGFADIAVMLGILLFVSIEDREKLIRFLDTATLIPLFWSIFSLFQIDLITPDDANVKQYYSIMWLIPLAILVGFDAFLRLRGKKHKPDLLAKPELRKKLRAILIALPIAGMLLLIACQFSESLWMRFGGIGLLRIDDNWGSFRGSLWRIALRCFSELKPANMIYGIGPDCFVYAYEKLGVHIAATGQWENVTYANAHNEMLTMLVNEGALGLLTYLGIFVSSLKAMIHKYHQNPMALMGILVVAGYLSNGLFAFQQAVSSPFIFAVMGLIVGNCTEESSIR